MAHQEDKKVLIDNDS